MTERYVTIHGHFYQPPRENPWLGKIERQPSAAPFHDWNERITAECYAPNAAARILDDDGRLAHVVNNYSRMSFNFGPSLLAWMETRAPEVYAAILAADRSSAERFSGHGSALAQAYSHLILPLAAARDVQTEVRWGIADFRHRFGREPEGMWLPETAADVSTLDALAAEGIRFTILAPSQAARVRPLGGSDFGRDDAWEEEVGEAIDTTRPYLHRLPSGRSIVLFFYDGAISRAVAFEDLLDDGEGFAARLAGAFDTQRAEPQLVHIATDGETYGHHHRFGEMALAYALARLESAPDVRLTNYGEYLERHPPEHEVEIRDMSAWSCAHGVERWRGDCGCATGGEPGWNQEWREPLRGALDWLRGALDERYEAAAGELFHDPWEARDASIEIALDGSAERLERFFTAHARRPLTLSERARAMALLDLERQALTMYTSCGWFFNDLSGIETVQVMAYAGRAVELAAELFGDDLEPPFLARLEEAESNLLPPAGGTGREIYERSVRPLRVASPARL